MISRRARRLPAALLAAFWLATLVGGMIHGVHGGHVYCPDHSAFEETGKAGAPHDDGTVAFHPGGEASRHEACAFAFVGAKPALPEPDVAIAPAALVPEAPPAIALTAFAPAPIPLLHNAPKSSPPAPLA